MLQEDVESRLLEVMVSSQRVGDTPLLHDHERNAIGQGPTLVRPGVVERDSSIHQFPAWPDDLVLRFCSNAGDKTPERAPVGGNGQSIRKLCQDPRGSDDRYGVARCVLDRSLMRAVFGVENGEEVVAVGE